MGYDDILKVIGIAALPVSELRGAIPIAIGSYDFAWYYAYLFGVIGNLLPVPFILLFLSNIVPWLGKIRFLDRLMRWYFASVRRRGKLVERYEWLGLAVFVAIPLPFTGAWTGSILAVLLGLRLKQAVTAIITGVLVAGVIVTAATVLGWAVAGLFTA